MNVADKMLLQAGSKTRRSARNVALSRRSPRNGAYFINHDMLTFARASHQFDAMVCVYDSINYLDDKKSVGTFMENAFSNLKAGGVFIFDASLESNSLNDPSLFVQRGSYKRIQYQRRSIYDCKTKIHTTLIRIRKDGKLFEETHREHVFDLGTLRNFCRRKGI